MPFKNSGLKEVDGKTTSAFGPFQITVSESGPTGARFNVCYNNSIDQVDNVIKSSDGSLYQVSSYTAQLITPEVHLSSEKNSCLPLYKIKDPFGRDELGNIDYSNSNPRLVCLIMFC